MIKNWGIRRERGKWRRYRYSLMVGAEFEDMIGLLERIANVCGRPRKENGVTAYSLAIHSNETKTLDFVKSVVSAMAPPGAQSEQVFFSDEELPEQEETASRSRGGLQELVEEPQQEPAQPYPQEYAQDYAPQDAEAPEQETVEEIQEPEPPPARKPPSSRVHPQTHRTAPRPEPVPEPQPEETGLPEPSFEEPQPAPEPAAAQAPEEPAPAMEETVSEPEPQATARSKPNQDEETVPDYLEAELQKLESRLIPKNIAQAAAKQQESEDVLRARIEGEIKAKLAAEDEAKKRAEEFMRKEAEMKLRIEAEMRVKMEAEARAKQEAEAKAKMEVDSTAQKEAEIKARLEAEIRAKLEAETKAAAAAKEPPPAVKHPTPAPVEAKQVSKKITVPEPVKKPTVPPAEPEPVAEGKKGPLVLEFGATGPRKQTWSIEIPLVPTYNFETLVVGANRFAHAAGMSVIESPGTMYNPLMMHGTNCCGKSHFLHAIAYGMSKDLGQQNIFVTDGVRLSRGVLRLAKEGKLETLDKTLADIKALFIDDIHLMSVTEGNKAFLSKWLNYFVEKKKQVVLTSLYPPKNLSRLEDSLGFQFNQGWIVELKPSSPAQVKTIVLSMVGRSGIEIPDEDVNRYLTGSGLNLNQVADVLDKLRVMSNVMPREGPPNYGDMLADILGTKEEDGTMLPTEDDIKMANAYKRPEGASWGGWGFFHPQGMQQYVPWSISQIFEKMKELGIGGGFDSSVQLEYDSANLLLSAFRITDVCSEKGLRGAVVILPPEQFASEQARADFAHTLEHLTSTLFIRCAMIETKSLAKSSSYLGAVLNMVM